MGGVVLEVSDELALRGVLWEVLREGQLGELAELLGEVELQPVVGALLPQRGDAVGALHHHERHALLLQARRRGQPRRPRADDHRPVDQHAPPVEHVLVVHETE